MTKANGKSRRKKNGGMKTKKVSKNGRKNKDRIRNKILYLIAGLLAAIVIFSAISMTIMVKDEVVKVFQPEEDPPEVVKEPHLYVEDVFFLKTETRAEEDEVDIMTTVYITNDGLANAKDVKIIAWPIDEDKNLALDKSEKPVGSIPIEKTTEIDFSICVPSGAKHKVDLLIFERGRLILRGSGSVVIEGSYKNTPKFQTTHIMGTGNDSDYDGMSDTWEIYYGLDPYDPEDANKDADGDGLSNFGEYQQGTEPQRPVQKDGGSGDDEDNKETSTMGMEDGSAAGILVLVFVIIVIIIMVVLAVLKASKHEIKNAPSTSPGPNWVNQYGGSQPANQNVQRHCVRCGGWVMNDNCLVCGVQQSSLTPKVAVSQTAKSTTELAEPNNAQTEVK